MDEAATERLRAAIGRNADHYLARWRAMDAAGRTVSWNWPACLFNLYWLAWRKLWAVLALFLLANFAVALLFGLSPALNRWVHLPMIALTFVTGAFGNHLYRRKVGRLAASSLDQAALARRGGTSPLALGIALAATLAVAALIAAAALQSARAA